MDARGRHHQRHHQRGGEAVRGHVAQHDADPAAAQTAEGVEVAAHRVRRIAARRHLGVALEHGRRGQQLELEIVRQLELSPQPLLARRSRSTSRAFSTAAPIWLATAVTSFRSPRVNRSPPIRSVRLMTPTQRSGAARRAIADRHAQERLPPIAPRLAAVGGRRRPAATGS